MLLAYATMGWPQFTDGREASFPRFVGSVRREPRLRKAIIPCCERSTRGLSFCRVYKKDSVLVIMDFLRLNWRLSRDNSFDVQSRCSRRVGAYSRRSANSLVHPRTK